MNAELILHVLQVMKLFNLNQEIDLNWDRTREFCARNSLSAPAPQRQSFKKIILKFYFQRELDF